MKKIHLALMLMLMLSLLVTGCLGTNGKTDQNQPSQQPSETNDGGQKDNSQGTYPDEIAAWLETFKPIFVADSKVIGNETFLMVSWGEKSTGGYDVNIKEIKETAEKITVLVEFTEPEPGAMVTQALTYPNAVEVLDKATDKDIEFTATDPNIFIPHLYGYDAVTGGFEKRNDYIAVTEFKATPEQLHVSGIARAFEGGISYALLDSEGETLDTGHIMTAAGAPNWGGFNLDYPAPPLGQGDKLQLFEASAKDGSKTHILEFNLTPAK
ncbi:protease complex subunit PrcB family protein [Metallumcola ferriviriculae]|uniref:Protease complex subunit PrcB family protein n=1 Tax=Metallumcola ferriviriculae TaxID=3039180 RepID=A0AAU0UTB4_9FIRM|nr:protease complex subunit PrcB family protein [Desulfitibacteraceae bacterium MK1]